jgi:3-oxoacyl-[acyl-carrier-protein] synthase-1
MEAVIATLSLNRQRIFPHLHFSTPMPELGLVPVCSPGESRRMDYALSNSFGFGGNCTSLLFKHFRS